MGSDGETVNEELGDSWFKFEPSSQRRGEHYFQYVRPSAVKSSVKRGKIVDGAEPKEIDLNSAPHTSPHLVVPAVVNHVSRSSNVRAVATQLQRKRKAVCLDNDDDDIIWSLFNYAVEELVKSLRAKAEASLLRTEIIRRSMESHGMKSKGTSSVSEPSTLTECQNILESISDLDDDIYFEALEKFVGTPEWRPVFIKMSNSCPLAWLNGLKD